MDEITVVVPRKEGMIAREEPVAVWPLIETTLSRLEADEMVCEAARLALASSDGCIVLANFLHSQSKPAHKAEHDFKVPLLVLAARMAREDGGADSIYDPEEGTLYFETDDEQYAFPVFKDWTVDWETVADEVMKGYAWSGVETQTWALDRLLSYLEYDGSATFGGDAEEEEDFSES